MELVGAKMIPLMFLIGTGANGISYIGYILARKQGMWSGCPPEDWVIVMGAGAMIAVIGVAG